MRRRNHLLRSELNPTPLFQTPFRKSLRRIGNRTWLETMVPARLERRWEAELQRTAAELTGDRYRESNRATAELTGLDLAGYGWQL